MARTQSNKNRMAAGIIALLMGVMLFSILMLLGFAALAIVGVDSDTCPYWWIPLSGAGVVAAVLSVLGLIWSVGRGLEAIGIMWDD